MNEKSKILTGILVVWGCGGRGGEKHLSFFILSIEVVAHFLELPNEVVAHFLKMSMR